MRRFDEPLEPDVATALLAIDATLQGDPVDPEHAELAELALILSAERPRPQDAFAAALDERVAARFAPPARPAGSRRPGWRRRWLYAPGAMVAAAAAVAIVVVLSGGSSSHNGALLDATPAVSSGSAASSSGVSTAESSAAASSSASASATSAAASSPTPLVPLKRAPTTFGAASGAAAGSGSPQVITSGRQVVQSAQLALSARPSQIDAVAQQVFDVIASEKGVVNNSHVTATRGSDGYATFQLSVPSSSLSATMSALSRLQGARVISRTDASQDITGQVGGAGRRLADARALRRSLLRQLAAATTTEQVDSLKIQISDAEASISRDQAALNGLHGQVQFSSISVTVNASAVPVTPVAHGSSFTLGRSAHDAGRVLIVVAGVALIALAVLVPLGLVAALVAWIGLAIRRRRREQVLDLL
jgi:hypothetical protein